MDAYLKEIEKLKARRDEVAEETRLKLIEWKRLAEQSASHRDAIVLESSAEKEQLKDALLRAESKTKELDEKHQSCLQTIEKLEADLNVNSKASNESKRELVQMASKLS